MLKPLDQTLGLLGGADIVVAEVESNTDVYVNLDDDEELIDTGHDGNQKTFAETMREYTQKMQDFVDGLEYQIQFNNNRMLQTYVIEVVGFIIWEDCINTMNITWSRVKVQNEEDAPERFPSRYACALSPWEHHVPAEDEQKRNRKEKKLIQLTLLINFKHILIHILQQLFFLILLS
ncbi:hypothetical protein BDQ17DRAFT_1336463 [Cyathus striatus]|nr:hypothetical protein BDQ17DRAFT_1336463 [Cyathus striatus]